MVQPELPQYLADGCYQVVYYAKDRAGNVSLPERKFLNVISSGGDDADTLQPPELKMSILESVIELSWQGIASAEGYKLVYAPYPDAEYINEIDVGKQKEILFDGKGFAFYCAVKTHNSKVMSDLSNIEFFDLR